MQRPNRLREAVENGDVAFGARARTNSPILVDVYGEMGFEFVFIDTEHTGDSPLDSPRLQQFARAADAAGIEILVRLTSGRPTIVRKVLDAGIRNLVIPRVETAKGVREAVKAARFTYDGGLGNEGSAAPIQTTGVLTSNHIRNDRTKPSSSVLSSRTVPPSKISKTFFRSPNSVAYSSGQPISPSHMDTP